MVIAPARIAGDPGSNPGPGENCSRKLFIYIYIYTNTCCVCEYFVDCYVEGQRMETVTFLETM